MSPATPWTEMSVAETAYIEGVPTPDGAVDEILFEDMVLGVGFSIAATTWTEMVISATPQTEMTVPATTWTELSI